MRPRSIAALLMCCLPAAGVVIDRIAVIVDKHVVKASDIDRDVRVTEFLNRTPLDTSPNAKRQAAQRLIDQTVIREEMDKGGYSKSNAEEVDGVVNHMVADRFGASKARFEQALSQYGTTEAQLRMQLQWQLDVLTFINDRFRPGVLVTEEQVKSYYEQHRADLQRQFPQLKTYDALTPKIRASLEGEQLNKSFEDWLGEARKQDRIVYRQEALQ